MTSRGTAQRPSQPQLRDLTAEAGQGSGAAGWTGRPPPVGSCQASLNTLTAALRRSGPSALRAAAGPPANTCPPPLQRGARDPVTLDRSFLTQSCLPQEPRALPQSAQMPPRHAPQGLSWGKTTRGQMRSERTAPSRHRPAGCPHPRPRPQPSPVSPPSTCPLCVDLVTEVSVPAGVSL